MGQYNVSNLKYNHRSGVGPACKGIDISNCSFNVEKTEAVYIVFDDVIGANVSDIKLVKAADNPIIIKLKDCASLLLWERCSTIIQMGVHLLKFQ